MGEGTLGLGHRDLADPEEVPGEVRVEDHGTY